MWASFTFLPLQKQSAGKRTERAIFVHDTFDMDEMAKGKKKVTLED